MIARALVSASQNILLDEPCSALDLGNQQVVLQLIGDLAHRQARTVLFTTHDPNHALQVASHTLLLLPEGRWLAGETADVLSETHLRQAYGLPVRPDPPCRLRVPSAGAGVYAASLNGIKPACRRYPRPTSPRIKRYRASAAGSALRRASW